MDSLANSPAEPTRLIAADLHSTLPALGSPFKGYRHVDSREVAGDTAKHHGRD